MMQVMQLYELDMIDRGNNIRIYNEWSIAPPTGTSYIIRRETSAAFRKKMHQRVSAQLSYFRRHPAPFTHGRAVNMSEDVNGAESERWRDTVDLHTPFCFDIRKPATLHDITSCIRQLLSHRVA